MMMTKKIRGGKKTASEREFFRSEVGDGGRMLVFRASFWWNGLLSDSFSSGVTSFRPTIKVHTSYTSLMIYLWVYYYSLHVYNASASRIKKIKIILIKL